MIAEGGGHSDRSHGRGGTAWKASGAVVRRLVDRGYEVLATDRVAFDESPAEFIRNDLGDPRRVGEMLDTAEGVIHMAAIPGPTSEEPRQIFDNNVRSTFNVLMAAEELNIRRVVFSSSAFGMGWAHDPGAFVPLYLPLDEEHPMMPFEPYGLSKQVGECIGAMVAHRSSTSVVSLRFTNVVWPEILAGTDARKAPNASDVGVRRSRRRRGGARAGTACRADGSRGLHARSANHSLQGVHCRAHRVELRVEGGDSGRAKRERQRDQHREGTAEVGVDAAGRLERRLAGEPFALGATRRPRQRTVGPMARQTRRSLPTNSII